MNPETHQNDLQAQVLELQQELRELKQFALGGLVVAAVAVLLLQIHERRSLKTSEVVANEITLTDASGNARARLAVFPEGSGLETYAPSGERRVQLIGSGEGAALNLNIPVDASSSAAAAVNLLHNNVLVSSMRAAQDGFTLEMHSKPGNGTALLSMLGTTASLTLSGTDEQVPKIWLSADRASACTALGGGASSAGSSLCLHSPGLPTLELSDVAGNRAVVGVPQSADLSAEDDSAASVIPKHQERQKGSGQTRGREPLIYSGSKLPDSSVPLPGFRHGLPI